MSTMGTPIAISEQQPTIRNTAMHERLRTGPNEDRLLRAVEVQRELGVSRATAYRMMTDGTLPSYRFGGRQGGREMIRVSLKELRAWIAAQKIDPSSSAR